MADSPRRFTEEKRESNDTLTQYWLEDFYEAWRIVKALEDTKKIYKEFEEILKNQKEDGSGPISGPKVFW